MINFDKYQKEAQNLIHIMRADFQQISVQVFDSIQELLNDKSGFEQFQTARSFFEKIFGYDMARVGDYIFMVKKVRGKVVYIEIELMKGDR